ASNVHFLDLKRPELAQNVTRRMVFFTKRYGFSGIFLKFDSDVLLTPGFEQFVELLDDEIKKEKKRSGMRKLRLILSISSNWVKYVYRRMPKFDAYFDAFYLWADEISSTSEFPIPSVAVPVDPLHNSELVPLKDSLARNAEHLAGSGVPRKKIVIGLSTWARSYFIRKNEELKTPEVESLVYSNEDSGQTDGTLGYHEVCHLLDSKNKHQQLHYDNRSETTSLIIEDQWYSFNEPEHAAFIHKLDWISNHEFGGIGLFSIQGDDPLNNCTRGLLPLHRTVGDRFKCRRGTKRGNLEQLGECTRLCFLDLEESRNSFAFEQLQPGWCSHMVIGQASVNPYVYSGPSKGMNLALKLYNDWERERKPFLIATASPTRFILIERIRHLLDEHNADGVELNCANGGLDGPNNAYQMNSFLADLRRTLGWKKQILISLNPISFVDQLNFDFANMVRSVDYIVAIGYRYHRSTNTHTGHHSPLFKNSTLLNQPKMTIQGTLEELIYKKLIVSLSAEAMSQHFVEDIYGTRSWESRRIGESASSISQNRIRAHGPGVVSQTQVCTIMKEATTISHFLNELGVPYLVNNDREFIAFDNSRSIQIKTVWLSLQNIAGIALHGLEHDNIAGECPEGEPFHLLKTIAQSQNPSSPELLENSDDEEGELTEEEKDLKAKKISNDQTLRCQQFDEFTTNFTVFCSLSLDNVEIDMLAKLPLKQCNVFLINNLAKLDEHGKTVENEKNKEKLEKIKISNDQTLRCQQFDEFTTNFTVFCSLSLDSVDIDMLTKLPLKQCNVFLINNLAKLDEHGKTVENEENKEKLEKIVSIANKKEKINLWGEVGCDMSQTQWERIINDRKREKTVAALNKLMTTYQLSGLLLDCDKFMRPPLRRDFSQFLNELNSELFEKDNEKENEKNVVDELMDCMPRLALKIQLSRKNISEVYEPEQLNKLLKFILLPSSIALSKAKAKSATILTLEQSKIKSNLIILELPTFAILQKREEEKAEPLIVTQKEVCQFIRKPGVQHHTRYDAVTSYWKTGEEWLSGENEQTIKYKVQYALQRRLGGVLLKSLESDDPEDFCKNGGYGLLNTVHTARCGV
uniref:Chitinase II domain-containing protein n=1 Tax=Meloidogyne floridensis TaxID=298350 RepID=A0A915P6U1_9BILA